MDDHFIRNRITELRLKKGISEYKMSLDLGHGKGYIQDITSGRSLPPIPELFNICEYLNITPQDFFDEGNKNPILVNQILEKIRTMEDDDLSAILGIVCRISD